MASHTPQKCQSQNVELPVRGAIIPNCDDIKELLSTKETSEHPQLQLSSLKADDLFIGMLKYSFLALLTFHLQCILI